MGPMRQKSSFSFFTKLLNKIQNYFHFVKISTILVSSHVYLNFLLDIALKKKLKTQKNDILSLCSPIVGSFETGLGTYETYQKNCK